MFEIKEKVVRFTGNEVANEFYDLIVRSVDDAIKIVGVTNEAKLDELRVHVSNKLAEIKNLQASLRLARRPQ